MKATLEFNLPEDNHEYELTSNAISMSIAICDIREMFRSKLKHANLTAKEYKLVEEMSSNLHEILDNQKISHLF